eukprot:1329344-Amorphochlora_amoeboformis.AAC.2
MAPGDDGETSEILRRGTDSEMIRRCPEMLRRRWNIFKYQYPLSPAVTFSADYRPCQTWKLP